MAASNWRSRGAKAPITSRSVLACEAGAWHIHSWAYNVRTGEVLKESRTRYRCRSWRHEGDCRRWRAAQNFARLHAALLTKRRQDVLLLVLTIDPKRKQTRGGGMHGRTTARAWRDAYEAFNVMRECWRSFAKSLRRTWGAFDYASTVEVTRNGWPHLNVILHHPHLAGGLGSRQREQTRAWLRRHAMACGFGGMLSVERAKSRAAVAGYAVKVAGELEMRAARYSGEVVKLSQLPMAAPLHFRRLRTSPGFLPPPFKQEGVTGQLKRSPVPLSSAPASASARS